jgi:hypothetical protein
VAYQAVPVWLPFSYSEKVNATSACGVAVSVDVDSVDRVGGRTRGQWQST